MVVKIILYVLELILLGIEKSEAIERAAFLLMLILMIYGIISNSRKRELPSFFFAIVATFANIHEKKVR